MSKNDMQTFPLGYFSPENNFKTKYNITKLVIQPITTINKLISSDM